MRAAKIAFVSPSPVPTYTRAGSAGSIAIAPHARLALANAVGSTSKPSIDRLPRRARVLRAEHAARGGGDVDPLPPGATAIPLTRPADRRLPARLPSQHDRRPSALHAAAAPPRDPRRGRPGGSGPPPPRPSSAGTPTGDRPSASARRAARTVPAAGLQPARVRRPPAGRGTGPRAASRRRAQPRVRRLDDGQEPPGVPVPLHAAPAGRVRGLGSPARRGARLRLRVFFRAALPLLRHGGPPATSTSPGASERLPRRLGPRRGRSPRRRVAACSRKPRRTRSRGTRRTRGRTVEL